MALHRARQAAAERLHRELQRPAQGRVPQRDAVHLARPCQGRAGRLAARLQHPATTLKARLADASRVRNPQRPEQATAIGRCATRGLRAHGRCTNRPDGVKSGRDSNARWIKSGLTSGRVEINRAVTASPDQPELHWRQESDCRTYVSGPLSCHIGARHYLWICDASKKYWQMATSLHLPYHLSDHYSLAGQLTSFALKQKPVHGWSQMQLLFFVGSEETRPIRYARTWISIERLLPLVPVGPDFVRWCWGARRDRHGVAAWTGVFR